MREFVGNAEFGNGQLFLFSLSSSSSCQALLAEPGELYVSGYLELPPEIVALVASYETVPAVHETPTYKYVQKHDFDNFIESRFPELISYEIRRKGLEYGILAGEGMGTIAGVNLLKRLPAAKTEKLTNSVGIAYTRNVVESYINTVKNSLSPLRLRDLPLDAILALKRMVRSGVVGELEEKILAPHVKHGPLMKTSRSWYLQLKSGISLTMEPDVVLILIPRNYNIIVPNNVFLQILDFVTLHSGEVVVYGYKDGDKYYLFDGRKFFTMDADKAEERYNIITLPTTQLKKAAEYKAMLRRMFGSPVSDEFLPCLFVYYLQGGSYVRVHSLQDG